VAIRSRIIEMGWWLDIRERTPGPAVKQSAEPVVTAATVAIA
jgi:hypothetical protein